MAAKEKKSSFSTFVRLGSQLSERADKAGPTLSFLISVLLSLLIFWGLHNSLLSGWRESIATETARVKVEEERNKDTERIVKDEQAFLTEFRKVEALYSQVAPLLPQADEVSEILGQVEIAAQKNSVTLTGLQALEMPKESPKSDKLYERSIPTTAVGKYGDVFDFLSELASMSRILVVRDYIITAIPDSKQVKADFTLEAFNAPPDAEKKRKEQEKAKKPAKKNASKK